jgi:uncharacterized membrane protein YfcA
LLLDPLMLVLLGFLGAFAGFLGALLGVGGGIIVVPILVLGFSLDTRIAVGTSLLMVTFTALSGSYAYYLQRRIDWKVGIITALFTVPGASLGAYATKFFSSKSLALIFGATLCLIALALVRRSYRGTSTSEKITHSSKTGRWVWNRRIVDRSGTAFEYEARVYSSLLLFFVGGLASGFLGIGGGLIVVPVLSAYVGLPIHLAVATSMLAMIFTSISGVSTHLLLGNVKLEYAIPLVIGILAGTQLGARTAKRLRSVSLERVFAFAMVAIGILLILTKM